MDSFILGAKIVLCASATILFYICPPAKFMRKLIFGTPLYYDSANFLVKFSTWLIDELSWLLALVLLLKLLGAVFL